MGAKKVPVRTKAGTSKVSADDRRAAFVEAYLCNGNNVAEAARTAGFSPKTAHAQGARLLKDVRVSTVLNSRRTEIAENNELSTNEIMADMARALRFDPRKLYNKDGTLKPIHELDDDTALCLTGIEVVVKPGPDGEAPQFVKKIKWETKSTARDQALKVFGMYEKDNKQKAGALDGLPRELIQLMVDRLKVLSNVQR
jgi:phage terminase small subunit